MFKRFAVVFLIVFLVACSKVDITGKWEGTLTSDSGVALNGMELMLNQNNKEITGTLTIRELGAQIPVKGSLVDGKLTFATEMKEGFYMSYSGPVVNNSSSGKADVVMQGPDIGTKQEQMKFEIKKT